MRARAASSIAVVSRSRARDDQPALAVRPAHPHLNGILRILATGAPRRDLPQRYESWHTVSSRFYRWQRILDAPHLAALTLVTSVVLLPLCRLANQEFRRLCNACAPQETMSVVHG